MAQTNFSKGSQWKLGRESLLTPEQCSPSDVHFPGLDTRVAGTDRSLIDPGQAELTATLPTRDPGQLSMGDLPLVDVGV